MCGNSSAQHVHSRFSRAQFHFYLPGSIPSPFWNSLSAFSLPPASNIRALLCTSRFLTLALSSLHTNGSSSFNLISYTSQFSPYFSPHCSFLSLENIKSVILFCFHHLFFKYYTPQGFFLTLFKQPRTQIKPTVCFWHQNLCSSWKREQNKSSQNRLCCDTLLIMII